MGHLPRQPDGATPKTVQRTGRAQVEL
jgi:hypothetical protein